MENKIVEAVLWEYILKYYLNLTKKIKKCT